MTRLASALLGVCVAAVTPTNAALAKQPPPDSAVDQDQPPEQMPESSESSESDQGPRVSVTDVFPAPSLRLDLGPAFRPALTPRPSFSVFIDIGVTLYVDLSVRERSGLNSLDCCTLTVRPALGYRHDTIDGRRDLAELGLEVGFVGGSKVGVSYRPALVLGGTPTPDGVYGLALGIRHGPSLTYLGGVFSLNVSHEYLGLPAPEHGLRIGLAVDLSPVVLLYQAFRNSSFE